MNSIWKNDLGEENNLSDTNPGLVKKLESELLMDSKRMEQNSLVQPTIQKLVFSLKQWLHLSIIGCWNCNPSSTHQDIPCLLAKVVQSVAYLSDKCYRVMVDAKNQKSDFRIDSFEEAIKEHNGFVGLAPGKLGRILAIYSDDQKLMPPPERKIHSIHRKIMINGLKKEVWKTLCFSAVAEICKCTEKWAPDSTK